MIRRVSRVYAVLRPDPWYSSSPMRAAKFLEEYAKQTALNLGQALQGLRWPRTGSTRGTTSQPGRPAFFLDPLPRSPCPPSPAPRGATSASPTATRASIYQACVSSKNLKDLSDSRI